MGVGTRIDLTTDAAGRQTSDLRLAEFVAGNVGSELPATVVDSARVALIDTCAACLATHDIPSRHGDLIDLVASWGTGAGQRILGTDLRAAPPFAALANGALARGANLDDCHDPGGTHPSAVVVPAVLAVAGRDAANGSVVLRAIAVGGEVVCRLGAAAAAARGVPMDRWFVTTVLGVFGATAGACAMLSLDAARTRHAFGIALDLASGTLSPFSPAGQSSDMRGIVAGFAAQSGVVAAAMAERGITGPPDSLGGRFGLGPAFFDGALDEDLLTGGLGRRWECLKIGQKVWPVVRYLNAYVEATRRIFADGAVAPDDVVGIDVHASGYVEKFFEPRDAQAAPQSYNAAVHALPFLIALMACRGDITSDGILAALNDPAVMSLAGRVSLVRDERYGSDNRPGAGRITVHPRARTSLSVEVLAGPGDPSAPMTRDGLRAKFRAAAASRTWAAETGARFEALWSIDASARPADVIGAISA